MNTIHRNDHHDDSTRADDAARPTAQVGGAVPRAKGSRAVLFVALSALGLGAVPGISDSLLGTVGSMLIETAHAAGPESSEEGEITPGYEEKILEKLWSMGIELPEEAANFTSLFQLSEEYGDATVIREGEVALLLTDEGTIPAPEGFYVFPDGLVTLVGGDGLIIDNWGDQVCNCYDGYWPMCRKPDGGWENCT